MPLKDAAGRRVAYARIDPAAEWVRDRQWYRFSPDGDVVAFSEHGLGATQTLGEAILGVAPGGGVVVEHRNGDPLDHRADNLQARVARTAEPADPRGPRRSRYRWVLWDPGHGAWVAYGYQGGRRVHLGRFDDELAAARVAAAWREENQSIHMEDDYHGGGFGRALKPPTALTEANRRTAPIGGKG